ncbi:hypothetical protein N5C67_20640 [Comamonas thiooxydans]|uniref:hypothetical protein n=1 Tax=Comamonas thiooxydans TaxID=363952 RepID=UPI00244D0865|nr:hypothetical protein [Comamonas thiooxydans]MDH1255062.1 hypothetical protein [Comamonas thiooxydans]
MTQDTNIRQFPCNEIPEQTLSVKRQRYNFCTHDKISLDEHSRTVKCAACDHVFDPFSFLKKEVQRLQIAWDDHKQVRQSLSELNERVDSLKKEEARLKARIKTAKAKVAPVIDVRNRAL